MGVILKARRERGKAQLKTNTFEKGESRKGGEADTTAYECQLLSRGSKSATVTEKGRRREWIRTTNGEERRDNEGRKEHLSHLFAGTSRRGRTSLPRWETAVEKKNPEESL